MDSEKKKLYNKRYYEKKKLLIQNQEENPEENQEQNNTEIAKKCEISVQTEPITTQKSKNNDLDNMTEEEMDELLKHLLKSENKEVKKPDNFFLNVAQKTAENLILSAVPIIGAILSKKLANSTQPQFVRPLPQAQNISNSLPDNANTYITSIR